MLSKNQIKIFSALKDKKQRELQGLFVAEGTKLCMEIVNSEMEVCHLLATKEWLASHKVNANSSYTEVKQDDLQRISSLRTPQDVMAIVKIPQIPNTTIAKDELTLFLDKIQDPGNLGTILRIADWFGIKKVFCSKDSVDAYNPKVVQATMGAICRLHTIYVESKTFLEKTQKEIPDFPIYGTFLDGKNMYEENLSSNGLILFGNEGNGISPELEKYVSKRLFIPNYPPNRKTSESLNISTACAVICAEFRRPIKK